MGFVIACNVDSEKKREIEYTFKFNTEDEDKTLKQRQCHHLIWTKKSGEAMQALRWRTCMAGRF